MQFNPHPTTVISGWYDTQDFLEIDTSQGAQTVKMMGVGEYSLQSEPRKKIALKIANGTTRPQYIAFNSAKGANAQNDEADNQVTMMEYTGTGYAVSSLKGYITQGNSMTTTEGRIVSAECIDTSVTPSLACVCVRESDQTCPTDCTCSDIVEPTPPPTSAVSEREMCFSTFLIIKCSHLMFISYLQPTISPTTPAPTPVPTPGPTASPTVSASPTKAPSPSPTKAVSGLTMMY